MVRKALSSFSPTSGAGPSGLRPSHLQEALRHSSGDQTLHLISEVVHLMLRGEIPDDIRQWICGASLMALRPVAVGESLRRLCSKVAVELMGSSVRSILEPIQVGVQTKAGCEAIIHTTRQWTKSFCDDPDRVWCFLICLTPSTVSLEEPCSQLVRRHFPWMAPWADTCYRHDSNLLVGSSRIRSRRGVQQGDPLGPSLFSLAVHPCVVEAIRISEAQYPGDLDYKAFFLDDGTIAGKAQAVKLFLDTLERLLLEIGLEIARSKTKVVPACSSVQNFTPHDFEGCCQIPDGNFKLLGAAFGSKDWCEALLDRRVSTRSRPSVVTMIRRGRLPSCALARDGPKSCTRVGPCPRRFRLQAFATLTATSVIPLAASLEARCRMRTGGLPASALLLGVSEPAAQLEHAPAAYVSSLAQSQELCARIWPGFDEYDIDGGLLRSDTESSLISSFLPNANIYGSSDTPCQKSLSAKIEAKVCQHLLDPSSRERHRLAHFVLNRVPGAGAWLFALPDSPETHIPPPLFRVSLRRRLRMPIWSQDSNCSLCGQVLDRWEITLLPVGAAGIGFSVTTSFETSSIRLLMIEPTLLLFWRNRAFSSPVTPLMMIAPRP